MFQKKNVFYGAALLALLFLFPNCAKPDPVSSDKAYGRNKDTTANGVAEPSSVGSVDTENGPSIEGDVQESETTGGTSPESTTGTLVSGTATGSSSTSGASTGTTTGASTPSGSGGTPLGGWYPNPQPGAIVPCGKNCFQVQQGKSCTNVCLDLRLTSASSPESNATCASGENRPKGSMTLNFHHLANSDFVYGTPSGTFEETVATGQYENASFCYAPGQGQDNQKTDFTIGCYCR